jgi:hypothetical protein
MATTTNFGWETPDDTDLVKDGAAAMRTLGNSIDTSFVDLKGGTTGQILTKNSGTDLDFVWSSESGDISGVTAGTGLSGGGTSGTVTVSIDTAVTADLTTSQVLTNKTLTSPEEKMTVSATAATGTVAFDTQTQGILYYTSDASANFTLNFTNVNSNLSIGNSLSLVFLNTNGATPYYPNVFQIDGSAVTPKWSGGTAPTAGNASSIDAYSFIIIKTANATFTTLAGGAVKFA